MFRILVAVDGSESSDRAVSHLLKMLGSFKEPAEIHLLNVQPALPSNVARFVPANQLHDYHRGHAEEQLASARALFQGASRAFTEHIGVGEPAHVIANYAREKAIDQVVMGTRGLGSVAGVMLGSVTTKVLGLVDAPVLLVR